MMVSINGKPSLDGKWNIADKEVHVKWREYERVLICKINPDMILTDIASIDYKGKRTAISKIPIHFKINKATPSLLSSTRSPHITHQSR
jgi:hypothetical protein